MDSYIAQFFGPLLIGLAFGLVLGFFLGVAYWRRMVAWANEVTRKPMAKT